MPDIHVPDDLWDTSMLPEGVLERWEVNGGERVAKGQAVAKVRVDDTLHSIAAPCAGVVRTRLAAGALIEPGCVIGDVG